MMSGCKEEKQYGLIIPKKPQVVPPKPKNIFAEDDDSDEEDGSDWVKKALKAESEKNKIKKQTKLNMQKALKEDPTIYQYDEVYDDMERAKTQSKVTSEEKKKPKYIMNLLKAAERRKKEQEYRIERMVQKEREAEGSMFADKESFVTSAYRAKLEEFRQMEEEESRMDRLESIGDVTKQQDMSGFYRHLYEQTVENPKETKHIEGEDNIIKDESVNNAFKHTNNKDKDEGCRKLDEEKNRGKYKKNRQYRQRVIEEDESDEEPEMKQEVENVSEIPESSIKKDDCKVNKEESPRKKQKQIEETEPITELPKVLTENVSNSKDPESISENSEKIADENKSDTSAILKIAAERKEKSKIWEKRTVGPAFEAALQRYYARKALKLSGT